MSVLGIVICTGSIGGVMVDDVLKLPALYDNSLFVFRELQCFVHNV